MSTALTRRRRANLLLLLASAIWGSAFVAQRVGADAMPPAAFTAVRHLIGVLALVPVVVWFDRRRGHDRQRRRQLTRAALGPGIAIGVALFAGSYLQQFGLAYTTAGKAGFITSLYMVLVPLLGRLLGMRIRIEVWFGVLLATAGLYLLTMQGGLRMQVGDALVLGCAAAWAIQILLIDRYAPSLDPIRIAIIEFATCAVLALLVSLVVEDQPFANTGSALIPLLYAGILSTGVAFTLQVVAQRDTRPSTAAMIMAMEAVFAVLFGVLFLSEELALRALAGCGLMFIGVLLAQRGSATPHAEPHT